VRAALIRVTQLAAGTAAQRERSMEPPHAGLTDRLQTQTARCAAVQQQQQRRQRRRRGECQLAVRLAATTTTPDRPAGGDHRAISMDDSAATRATAINPPAARHPLVSNYM